MGQQAQPMPDPDTTRRLLEISRLYVRLPPQAQIALNNTAEAIAAALVEAGHPISSGGATHG